MKRYIERYAPSERFNHWMVALTFVLAVLSGLALFHPAMFWLSSLFGGGTWDRVLHPYIAVLMVIFFIWLALRFWRLNDIDENDRRWLRQFDDVVRNRERDAPPVGRFNAGQKLVFWIMVWAIALLLISGIVIWQPWFAPAFPLVLRRIAGVVHAVSAFIAIVTLIIHVYAGIWVKGSISAMTRGTVTPAWARKHHSAWYRNPDR